MNRAVARDITLVVGGLMVGGGIGYILAKSKFERIANEEIASVKEAYSFKKMQDYAEKDVEETGKVYSFKRPEGKPYEEEDELAKDIAAQLIRDLDYSQVDEVVVSSKHVEKEVEAVFEVKRDPIFPYVIPLDEFMEDDDKIDKITISYFEADDTLVDERDDIIPDVEGTVGSENLERFGEASQNEDIVYIRNERLHTDFEVARQEGSYAAYIGQGKN